MILRRQSWTTRRAATAIIIDADGQLFCPWHGWMTLRPVGSLKHLVEHTAEGKSIPGEAFDYIHSWLSYRGHDTWSEPRL